MAKSWAPLRCASRSSTALASRVRSHSSVHLFKDVGIQKVLDTATGLGISTHLDPYLATTLGANEVKMMDHLSAYSAFANGGHKVTPIAAQFGQ